MGSLSKIKTFSKQYWNPIFGLLRDGLLSIGIFLAGIGVLFFGFASYRVAIELDLSNVSKTISTGFWKIEQAISSRIEKPISESHKRLVSFDEYLKGIMSIKDMNIDFEEKNCLCLFIFPTPITP